MSNIRHLHVDNELIASIVREAVHERHMSLSEIAKLAGVSVTTPARIYHGTKGHVHTTTAKRIASALGYEMKMSSGGQVRLVRKSERRELAALTAAQKKQVVDAVLRILREELDKI